LSSRGDHLDLDENLSGNRQRDVLRIHRAFYEE
jgi:hypothetical protein